MNSTKSSNSFKKCHLTTFKVMGQLHEQKVEQAASLLSVTLILLRKSETGWQPVVQIVVNAHVTDPLPFKRTKA